MNDGYGKRCFLNIVLRQILSKFFQGLSVFIFSENQWQAFLWFDHTSCLIGNFLNMKIRGFQILIEKRITLNQAISPPRIVFLPIAEYQKDDDMSYDVIVDQTS